MQMINGLIWIFLPAFLIYYFLFKLEKREKEHYKKLFIKTHAELTYIKYDMADERWDDEEKQ